MIRTKLLNMMDLTDSKEFATVHQDFNNRFGESWAPVPCRRWEYTAAIVFSEIPKNHLTVSERKDTRVCDAGSGVASRFTHYLGIKGFNVDAFDINVGGIKNLPDGNKVTYHNMSMLDVTFEDEIFDYVFCMSSIEHINAGEKFKVDGLPFDTGDTLGMLQLCRILKPGGVLVLTTDYARDYIPPPGPYGTHRVYNWEAILSRLINPVVSEFNMTVWGGYEIECDWDRIKTIEPVGWDYTEFILTMRKAE